MASCLCYFDFLRSGEVIVSSVRIVQEAHLSESDVHLYDIRSPTVVQVKGCDDVLR